MNTASVTHYYLLNGVYCAPVSSSGFEQQYVAVRAREARIYTDEIVAALPDVPRTHSTYKEWIMRKKSASRLYSFCSEKEECCILEIGCGNGWLSNLLAENKNTYVTGLDVNLLELQQAARVFRKENLSFVHDVFSSSFMPGTLFSDIIFAASIQYFPLLKNTINLALSKLQPDGHIHILDSYFYNSAAEQKAAALRTQAYYNGMGYPTMGQHYFHHAYHDLVEYEHIIAYNSQSFWQRLNPSRSPFPWIIIKPHRTPNDR